MSAALEQTLALLAEETRDEDKFAGLLLIAKTVRPDDADAVRKVFGAMSFRFLRRLLLTDHTEGGDERVLQEVSVSIVASFCDDESMATSPQMVGLAPALFKLLRSHIKAALKAEEEELVTNMLRTLVPMVMNESGSRLFLQQPHALSRLVKSIGEVSVIANASAVTTLVAGSLVAMVTHLVANGKAAMDVPVVKEIAKAVPPLAKMFRARQDALKFELLKCLVHVVKLVYDRDEKDQLPASQWSDDIRAGLRDILLSRIGQAQRDPALALLAIMLRRSAIDWIFGGTKGSSSFDHKFAVGAVNLACIEVRVCLEDSRAAEAREQRAQEILPFVYDILEVAIMGLGNDGSQWVNIPSDVLVKTHDMLVATFGTALETLYEWRIKNKETPGSIPLTPSLVATVRIVAAWLASETGSMQKEAATAIPAILDIAQQCPPSFGQIDWPALLSPALLQQTTDEAGRAEFAECGGPVWITEALIKRVNVLRLEPDQATSIEQLITCAGVLLNMVVLDLDLLTSNKPLGELMKKLLQEVSTAASELLRPDPPRRVILLGHFATTFLFASRNTTGLPMSAAQKDTLLNLVLAFLQLASDHRDGIVVTTEGSSSGIWDEVSELWFLCINALCTFSSLSAAHKSALCQAPFWIRTAKLFRAKRLPPAEDDDRSLEEALRAFPPGAL